MSIVCAIAGHKAPATSLMNEGFEFGSCPRCSLDLIKSESRWRAPPPGYRIVWKKRARRQELVQSLPPLNLTADYEVAMFQDERSGVERRNRKGRGPASLRGPDRRSARDRRKSLSKKQAVPSA